MTTAQYASIHKRYRGAAWFLREHRVDQSWHLCCVTDFLNIKAARTLHKSLASDYCFLTRDILFGMYSQPHSQLYLNPQLQCKFFSLPLEIRQEIYGYLIPYRFHAYLHKKKLHLSACIESRVNSGQDGSERFRPNVRAHRNSVTLRRLQSP